MTVQNIKNMDELDLMDFALEKGYKVEVNEDSTYNIEDLYQGWKYTGVNFTIMAAVLIAS